MSKKSTDQTPATAHDLEVWGGQLQNQIQGLDEKLQNQIQGLDKKIQGLGKKTEQQVQRLEKKIDNWGEKIINRIDNKIEAVVEIQSEEILGGNRDEISLIKDKQQHHEQRIATLEQKTSV